MLLTLLKYLVAFLYNIIIQIRFWLYKHHFLGSTYFDIPVICVGNLSFGGTGKTPMVDYLTSLLENHIKVGIISRGYKRKTIGFKRIKPHHTANDVGDEPLLLKLKHQNAEVAVGEQRIYAIPHLLSLAPQTQIIIMDDGFQHLSVKPQLSILMTDYNQPYWNDKLLPLGTLREPKKGAERADIIVVNKCPENFNAEDMSNCLQAIQPKAKQKVFFSKIKYKTIYALFYNIVPKADERPYILFSGLANADALYQHINSKFKIFHYQFKDHHNYILNDFEEIFAEHPSNNWITTEKDAVKLLPYKNWFEQHQINIWIQPIELEIISLDNTNFDAMIFDYLKFYFKN